VAYKQSEKKFCLCEFGSVRYFFRWFLGGSRISHNSTAVDATVPATDSIMSRDPLTIVVCSPGISQKRVVLRRNILSPSSRYYLVLRIAR
jgi:hypothetical protein